MGELPVVRVDQRMVGSRRPDQQPVRHQPQRVRVELGIGRSRIGKLRRGLAWNRDGRKRRLPRTRQRRRRPQAHHRPDQSRRRRSDLTHPRHRGHPRAHGGGRRGDAWRDPEPDLDGRDSATGGVPLGWQGTGKTRPKIPSDYTKFLDPNGLKGATLGLTRQGLGGFDPFVPTPIPVTDAFEHAFAALTAAGATVGNLDDPALNFNFSGGPGEFLVLCFDFRNDLKTYLSSRTGVPVAGGTLTSVIDFDNAHAPQEMPFFNQDIFDFCNSLLPGPNDPQPAFGGLTYNQAVEADRLFTVNNVD